MILIRFIRYIVSQRRKLLQVCASGAGMTLVNMQAEMMMIVTWKQISLLLRWKRKEGIYVFHLLHAFHIDLMFYIIIFYLKDCRSGEQI
jgi:hypothetical protein